MNIQWYPGHMTKTRRMIAQQIKNVDAVCEILDARIPTSSRNPDVDELTAGKPRLVVLNRVDQADPEATRRWAAHFRGKDCAVLECSAKAGAGTKQFAGAVRELLTEKIKAWEAKGAQRTLRVMILGIPNVGKSTLFNLLSGSQRSIVTEIAGTTRDVVEEQIRLGDVTLRLSDTAGLRETEDIIEQIGVRRAGERLRDADLILAVFDATRPLDDDDRRMLEQLPEKPVIAILNKSDQPALLEPAALQAQLELARKSDIVISLVK